MSNQLGKQDLLGNLYTCSDLLNKATTNNPVAAVGTGLANTYVPGSVTFSTTAVSNVYQLPYAVGLLMVVSLVSGTASSVSLNTGSAATNCVAAANTGTITDTKQHSVFVSMPSAALGTSQPGSPTAQFFSVSLNVPTGAQVNELAVFAVGKVAPGAAITASGINVIASGVINSKDTLQPPTNLVGSGSFVVDSTV